MMERDIDTVFLLLVASRWIHFASISVVFGSALFWCYSGQTPTWACLQSRPVAAALTIRLLGLSAYAAAVSGLAWLVATIASVTGGMTYVADPATLKLLFFETPFGLPELIRVMLLGLLALVAATPLPPSRRVWLYVPLGAALLVSQAWLGHAMEGGTGVLGTTMILSYVVHVLGAAVWVGGLPPLAFVLAEQRRNGSSHHDLLSRYSAAATISVSLIILSGIANSVFHLGDDFVHVLATTYGQVLLAKIVLMTMMLSLAALNRFIIMPRLREGFAEHGTTALRRSVALEALLALGVLGAAAILGISPPPN